MAKTQKVIVEILGKKAAVDLDQVSLIQKKNEAIKNHDAAKIIRLNRRIRKNVIFMEGTNMDRFNELYEIVKL